MKKLTAALACIISSLILTSNLSAPVWAQKNANAKQDIYTQFPDMPKFALQGKGPVLLRYKFKAGTITSYRYDVKMNSKMLINDNEMVIPIDMSLTGNYRIESIKGNGDADGTITVLRVKMTSDSPLGTNFDTDQDTSSENSYIKDMKLPVNMPVPFTVSSTGSLLSINSGKLAESLKSSGGGSMSADFDKTVKDLAGNSFIQVPLKEVSTGDIYEAGDIVQDMKGFGMLVTTIKYRVLTVSPDGKQVLLQSTGVINIKKTTADQTFTVKMNEGKLTGWILFDIGKGVIVRSAAISVIDMTVTQGTQSMRSRSDIDMKYITLDGQNN